MILIDACLTNKTNHIKSLVKLRSILIKCQCQNPHPSSNFNINNIDSFIDLDFRDSFLIMLYLLSN